MSDAERDQTDNIITSRSSGAAVVFSLTKWGREKLSEGKTSLLVKLVPCFFTSSCEWTDFPLTETRRRQRSELTSDSWNVAVVVCIRSRKNATERECIQRLIQIKGCIYIWKWETLGTTIQRVPTWTQAERNKTDVSVRNTLSQLHWLHRFVNTQYRQALIANIWRLWVYKTQTKVPPAATPSCACLCVHYDRASSQMSFGTLSDPGMVSESSQDTTAHLL